MDRRNFLKFSTQLAAGSAAAPFLARVLSSSALAQASSNSYKAIVCLNLFGGNDSNNTLVPIDNYYQEYAVGRGPLTLAQNSLRPLKTMANATRKFGTHPSLLNVAALYNSGNLAFVANTGTLNKPLTNSSLWQGASGPYNLLDHTVQIAEWQSSITQSVSGTGWAGRMADLFSSSPYYALLPTVVSTAGWSLFGQGANTNSMTVSTTPPSAASMSALQALMPTMNLLEQGDPYNHLHDLISQMQPALLNQNATVNTAIQAGSGIQTAFPNTPIGQQLSLIAQMIHGRTASETSRQVFFCQDANAYDTHTTQMDPHAANLACIDDAVGAFVNAMIEIGMFENTILFTTSDFGRAKQGNASGGSDHGWGGHHFVVGGAVKGGQIYGTFPSLIMGGADDWQSNGIWIPTTSSSQYAATLCSWMGVSASNTAAIFPELVNFSSPTLGFV